MFLLINSDSSQGKNFVSFVSSPTQQKLARNFRAKALFIILRTYRFQKGCDEWPINIGLD